MATPSTSAQHPTPKPTPRTTTTTGLTPAAASSPPRSVPSPAHVAKVGKSPYKPRSTAHTPLGGAAAAALTPTPLPSDRSPAPDGSAHRARAGTLGARSSATGASEGGATPAALSGLGLGLGGHANGAAAGATPGAAALVAALGLKGGGGGGGGGGGARDLEALNAARARQVLAALGTRWGFVCPDNVDRAAQRVGADHLDCLWDPPERHGAEPRTLSVAGSEFLVDVEWRGDAVTGAKLEFAQPSGDSAKDDEGSRILLNDLTGGEEREQPGYVPMDKFVANLQRLARTDQLGKDKVSCFKALDGIYVSLKKLWDYEVKQDGDGTKGRTERSVLCAKSGRPSKHPTEALCPRLDYWLDRRNLVPETANLDSTETKGSQVRRWALQLGCEAFDASQYPPIRNSTAWIADEVGGTVPSDDAYNLEPTTFINWLEPEPSFIPQSADNPDVMNLGIAAPLLPNVRFVAELKPPVNVPLNTAYQIFSLVGHPLPQEDATEATTLVSLLFPNETSTTEPPSRGKRVTTLLFSEHHFVFQGRQRSNARIRHQTLQESGPVGAYHPRDPLLASPAARGDSAIPPAMGVLRQPVAAQRPLESIARDGPPSPRRRAPRQRLGTAGPRRQRRRRRCPPSRPIVVPRFRHGWRR